MSLEKCNKLGLLNRKPYPKSMRGKKKSYVVICIVIDIHHTRILFHINSAFNYNFYHQTTFWILCSSKRLPPPNAKVKNEMSYTVLLLPLYVFMVWRGKTLPLPLPSSEILTHCWTRVSFFVHQLAHENSIFWNHSLSTDPSCKYIVILIFFNSAVHWQDAQVLCLNLI